jgi:hypothetical protein
VISLLIYGSLPFFLTLARSFFAPRVELMAEILALAGAKTYLRKKKLPEDAHDGILNGEDVAGLDLSATELVVLPACDTGIDCPWLR